MCMLMRCMLMMLLVLLLTVLPVQAMPTIVDSVTVRVEDSSGTLPPLIQKRMQASVQSIADQLLTGRRLDSIQTDYPQYEKIIHDVFDKILVGYTVTKVNVMPAATTEVVVQLTPWAEVINAVDVDMDVQGMPPEIQALALKDLEDVTSVFSQILVGLPIDATDWSNGILKKSLNEFMEKHLPEFWADFDIDPGSTTKIKLQIYPKGPVVRNIDLSMRSDTMPNMLLLNSRPKIQKRADIMLGVPIAFVTRHKEYFCQVLKDSLDTTSGFKSLRMQTQIDLNPGPRTSVMSRSDTGKYRFRVEGRLDIGRGGNSSDSTSFSVHAGQYFTSKDELFAQLEFYPQDVQSTWYLGYSHSILKDMELFTKYNVDKGNFVWGMDRKLDRFWQLRYEYAEETKTGELGLRYKLHDFVSLEYIHNNDDSWIRLIGNF